MSKICGGYVLPEGSAGASRVPLQVGEEAVHVQVRVGVLLLSFLPLLLHENSIYGLCCCEGIRSCDGSPSFTTDQYRIRNKRPIISMKFEELSSMRACYCYYAERGEL